MIKSRIAEKKENVVEALYELIEEIMDLPLVKKVLNIMFASVLLIGFVGLFFIGLFILLCPAGKYGITEWVSNFVIGYPVISFVWFAISIFTSWIIKLVLQEAEPQRKTI